MCSARRCPSAPHLRHHLCPGAARPTSAFMAPTSSFISSFGATPHSPIPPPATSVRVPRRARAPCPRRARLLTMCEKHTVQVGQVVAVETGKGLVDLARISAISSSGDTVDITLLEQFVQEMYVESKQPPTYQRVENIRPIVSEYVPSQQGWVILNQDLQNAKKYFEQRAKFGVKQRTVEVTAAPPAQLSEDALKRQIFTPTRAQAFSAAALSLPLSALCYSAFAAVRQTYQANPAGDDFLSGQVSRNLVLFTTAAASVSALVVGSALFLYALSKGDKDDLET